jgi:DNA-directed RNA polymerase subunit RPC12/RpoP
MTSMTYTCQQCGQPVTVAHAAAWPSQCPHCKTAPPTLIVKVPNG